MSERTTVLPRTIRADGQEENKRKRTSQKHPNSFPMILLRTQIFAPLPQALASSFLNKKRPSQMIYTRADKNGPSSLSASTSVPRPGLQLRLAPETEFCDHPQIHSNLTLGV